ncbi:MAG TPA: hypothetical protein VE177_00260 [Candidatus Binatus sp.]|nr:hypothetical protein [Candidatus Binatus sp.]
MTDNELLSLIEQEEANCLSTTTGKLAEQRRQAMQYYYGEPYGNEVEGRSQVVTTEVKDAVEEILPALMKIFTSSDEVVRFEPQNPDDEASAQQATDYINYIFSRVNNGFQALYCLFKDALLLKNGFLKVYWEEYDDNKKETYEGLTDDEFTQLSQDPGLEIAEHEAEPDPDFQKMVQSLPPNSLPPGFKTPQIHDVVFRRSKKYGKVCIDPVPPEEVLVSRETPNDLTKARFVEHRTKRSISDIRQMGYKVDDEISDEGPADAELNMEKQERNKFDDDWGYSPDRGTTDPASRRVWLCEAYLNVDYDEDGITEYRKVTKVGHKVLENEEFDSLPIIGGTAIMMPHKHYGLSIHDLVGDIQLIKSAVTRQLLDNQYIANNGRFELLDNMVNMDDFLTSRPGGGVRVKVQGAIKRMDTPILGAPAYQLLEYLDKIKQSRTGVVDFQQWMDPNALNAKATTAEISHSASTQRVELMARILAEGPVKDLFWKILELVSKHQQKPQIVKLRGVWTKVDPREWKNKFDMTITVGLGTGSQQTTLQGAMGIMQIQDGLMKMGLGDVVVTPTNMYQAAVKYAKAVFPKDAQAFFQDPKLAQPKPPQPDPEMLKIQAKVKSDQDKLQQKEQKMALDAQEADKQRQFEAFMAQMNQKFETEKKKFDALIEQASLASQSKSEQALQAREHEKEAQVSLMQMISEAHRAREAAQTDAQQTVLQGFLDRVNQQQQAFHDHLKMVHEAILAPKEIIRDEKGKAKGVRTVS